MQVIKSLVILVIGCAVITQCNNGNIPYQVSPSEAEQVRQLPPEKQIDAYLSRMRTTKPPNPFLAFVIAPTIDVRKHLQPRIVAEKDDVVVADLLVLAKIVCDEQGGCSQDPNLLEDLRKSCNRIENPTLRSSACAHVDEIKAGKKQ